MRIAIDFRNREQGEVFLKWFEEYGFEELCNSDLVNDDLPGKLFYKKIKECKLERENLHYDGVIKIS